MRLAVALWLELEVGRKIQIQMTGRGQIRETKGREEATKQTRLSSS